MSIRSIVGAKEVQEGIYKEYSIEKDVEDKPGNANEQVGATGYTNLIR